ncbi:MAG: enoyl-CoA hydratase/isomerase family protein [Flavobacteriaceae bacterium]
MTAVQSSGSVRLTIEHQTAWIQFEHPSGNACTSSMLAQLCTTLDELSERTDIGWVVLGSTGSTFCAGAHLEEVLALNNLSEAEDFFGGFARLILAMARCNHPILGRVQGKAVGGGVGILAACDYVIASEHTLIKLSELSIGLAPAVIAPAVARKIGASGLAALALSPAHWHEITGLACGPLTQRTTREPEDLDKAIEVFLKEQSAHAPSALKAIKNALWEDTSHWEKLLFKRAKVTAALALSPETQAALEKYRSK